ncbi:MAG: hypothetical protein DRG78_02370 [Epsilonproteobacteria bacterium]|nr:MAG: hypothetical protein DRG78_02370 [Campylobacterota bacterium]
MKSSKTLLILIVLTITSIIISGCAEKEKKVKLSAIDAYYKDKKDAEVKAKKISSFKTIDYLNEKNLELAEKEKYKKGDSVVSYIKQLAYKKAPNTVLLIDDKYNDLIFSKNSPTKFSSLTEFITYINMSGSLKYRLSIRANGRFKRIIFTSTNTLKKKLMKTKVDFANNIGLLEALNLIAKQLNITLDIDRYSKASLSVQVPTVIHSNAYTFLKNITNTNNLFLTVTKDTIKISKLKSKVYDIFITPLTISADSSNSLDSADGSTAKSKGKQDTALSFGYQIYDELEKNVKAIVGKEGMHFLNQASGQLTVKTQKDNLALVDTIVDKFNDMYSKQIEMRMQIVEITLNEKHQNGLDFGFAKFNSNGQRSGSFNTHTNNTIVSPSSSFSLNNVSNSSTQLGTNGTMPNLSAGMIQSTFDLKMLNQYGNVSVVSKPVLKTLNSIPAVLDVGLETEYLSEVKVTSTATASSTSTETSIAKDGIKIYMYPRIVRDNQILLTITPQITAVMNIQDTGVNGTKTKTINNRTFNSTLVFNNGETIMFAGLLSKYKKGSKSGMPWIDEDDSGFDYLGGTKGYENRKTELVLIITTKIINQ